MTLRRKMGLQIIAMMIGLLVISAALLSGMHRLEQDFAAASDGVEELRQITLIDSDVTVARTLLNSSWPETETALYRLHRALTQLEEFRRGTTGIGTAKDPAYARVEERLRDALTRLRAWKQAQGALPLDEVGGAAILTRGAADNVRVKVASRQADWQAERRSSLLSLALLCAAVILTAVLLGMWQYRSVLNPLRRLSGAVRRVATGQFGVRIMESGVPSGADNEFAGLAADFNRMAEQLDGFYKDLEQKVAEKSKELIRSERLASVGYLAAGVAHEINNPLGIISGYAEYALADLKNSGNGAPPADIDGTLKIIRDEAFRCKDITSKLLSLARQGETTKQRVNLADVAESVVSVLGGLRNFKDRRITVRAEARELLTVEAVEGEIKQVLMNLLINALEATDDGTGTGEVHVTVARRDDLQGRPGVVLTVSDNGRGMPAETLEHVFEPFFTDRPRRPDAAPRPGTGLGLSITHAIVQSHAGRITAHSDGPGQGSRFVVELPAAREA